VPIESPEITISTRRFYSRPEALELETRGRESPSPRTATRLAGIPFAANARRTLSARLVACESLLALSEEPSTTIRRSE
jgi:hypothetical protein